MTQWRRPATPLPLLQLGLTLAKQDIAKAWKDTSPSSLGAWKRGLYFCMGLERPIFAARAVPRNIPRYGGDGQTSEEFTSNLFQIAR